MTAKLVNQQEEPAEQFVERMRANPGYGAVPDQRAVALAMRIVALEGLVSKLTRRLENLEARPRRAKSIRDVRLGPPRRQ